MTNSMDTRKNPLTCIYDEETRQMRFDWDAEAHPEYNFLLDITEEELIQKMVSWIEDGAANDDAAEGEVND